MNQEIASALSYIPADDRDTWVKMAMAVKSEEGDDGFDVWDEWSRTADSYNPEAARSVWRSCRGSGVSIGSLYFEARSHGWTDDGTRKRQSREEIMARRAATRARLAAEDAGVREAQAAAARKAAWILGQTQKEQHAYLHKKGWPDALGAVWRPQQELNLLCIPMRVGGSLVGLQMIDKHGTKKYLKGQRTSGAEYLIDNSGHGAIDWFVEGYATGLSLRQSLQALKARYRIHIAFSANNLARIAKEVGKGFVVADRDESGTGERAAISSGLPYLMPDDGDWNDYVNKVGVFRSSMKLQAWVNQQGLQ